MSAYDEDPWNTDSPAADPWADEAQADVPPTSTPTPSKERNIAVNNSSSEPKITTTIKYGVGFDAPWTVIHSASVEEAKETLNAAKDLLELTAKVAKFAKTLDSGTAPAAARSGGNGGGNRPASTPPGQQAKSCSHGEMVYRTGNGAKGPWSGHFCPLERDNPDQCKPIFTKSR